MAFTNFTKIFHDYYYVYRCTYTAVISTDMCGWHQLAPVTNYILCTYYST